MVGVVTMRARLPRRPDLELFYAELLGKRMTMVPGATLGIGPKDKFIAADYRDEDGAIAGVVAIDTALGAAFAAAIGGVPQGMTANAGTTGQFSQMLWENLYEVLNVSSRWFQPHADRMVQLNEVSKPGAASDDVRSAMKVLNKRVDFKVEVQGYPPGQLVMLA